MNLHWSPLLLPPLQGSSHVSTLQILALCQLLSFYHILPLCSSSHSFNFQVSCNSLHFSAITNSFFLHLKLYDTEEHLPPTHLAVYSGCCFNMPLLLPLQCNIFCYHGPKQIIKIYAWCSESLTTDFSRNFGIFTPAHLWIVSYSFTSVFLLLPSLLGPSPLLSSVMPACCICPDKQIWLKLYCRGFFNQIN